MIQTVVLTIQNDLGTGNIYNPAMYKRHAVNCNIFIHTRVYIYINAVDLLVLYVRRKKGTTCIFRAENTMCLCKFCLIRVCVCVMYIRYSVPCVYYTQ